MNVLHLLHKSFCSETVSLLVLDQHALDQAGLVEAAVAQGALTSVVGRLLPVSGMVIVYCALVV